jgi:hypothetical protein
MFALKMVHLVEAHAGKLSDALIEKLRTSTGCQDLLRKVPAEELKMRTHEIFSDLSRCLGSHLHSEVDEQYVALGKRRARQGVPLSQFLFALNATHECLWEYLERHGLFEEPIELLGDLDLLHSLGRFFDRAAYSAALGYEGTRAEQEGRSPALSVAQGGKTAR